jgi:hypothetical protein
MTTSGRRIRLADPTTDGSSLLDLDNGYSLFTQHCENGSYVPLINRDRGV